MKICVLTHPGFRGHEEPRSFQLGARRVPVVAVLDRWEPPAQNHLSYFRVRDQEGRCFVLRHDSRAGNWELEAVYGRPAKAAPAARPARAPA
jgi:hypothetical protein